jgi:endoglucanase
MRFKLTRLVVCSFLALGSALHLLEAQVAMKVNDKDYLDTQGFSVFLYDSTYHPVFVDQKNTAMEMILHGQRIATNDKGERFTVVPVCTNDGPNLSIVRVS